MLWLPTTTKGKLPRYALRGTGSGGRARVGGGAGGGVSARCVILRMPTRVFEAASMLRRWLLAGGLKRIGLCAPMEESLAATDVMVKLTSESIEGR